MNRLLVAVLVAGLAMQGTAFARGHGGGSHHANHSSSTSSQTSLHKRTYSTGASRDSHGRIRRSSSAKSEFKHSHPCPSTGKGSGACPGYVIDHVRPLKRGGTDDPSNMQWQTKADARAKDRWE